MIKKVKVKKEKRIPPIHPGMILKECIESEEGLSQHRLAMLLKISFVRINEICNQKRSISPDTAIRLGAFFGQSPQYWMNLQTQYHLEVAERKIVEEIDGIKRVASNY